MIEAANRRGSRSANDGLRFAILLAITLLAFGLRLFRLDHQSLWVDEATSAYLTTRPPSEIVTNRANNLHPPTYFLALAGWARLAGRSEFSLRFFSVGTGLLLVPMLYRLCVRLFADARTGLVAALLAALSPAAIVYAQETRMYALLPVAYLWVLNYVLVPRSLRTRRDWIWLAISEVACLYLHFFSTFIVLAVNLLLLATRLRQADRRTWRRWGISQTLVGLSYVPWLLAMWTWGSDVPGKLSRHDWRASGMSLSRFLRLLWDFLTSGLVGVREVASMARWLNLTSALIALALLGAILLSHRRKLLLRVSGAFLLPLLGAYPVWYMRPLAHPRYLLFLVAPLLMLLAHSIIVLGRRPPLAILGGILAVAILGSNIVALRHVFFDARFFRPDMHALAETVAERATPGEAVLMPPADYSLWYYNPQPAQPVNLPGEIGAEGGELQLQELGPLLEERPGAFLVTYQELRDVDPRDQIPFLLELNGHLVERFSVDQMNVDHYTLGPNWGLPELRPRADAYGPLMLTGVYSQSVTRADDAVAVALRWRLTQSTGSDYRATVRLWDAEQQVAAADVRLLNGLGRPTSFWEAEEEALNTYVLPLPLGTPPLTYTLGVRVYGGDHGEWPNGEEWLALGPVRLLQAVGQQTDPYGSWSGTDWRHIAVPEVTEGLLLEGYAWRPNALKPGDTLYVSLRWRATRDNLAHYAPDLALRRNGEALDSDAGSLFMRYPTERWAADELLIETRELSMPPTLDPLQLALVMEERAVPLGEVAVARDALQWELPATAEPTCARLGDVAELVGYKWRMENGESRIEDGMRFTILLYWQAPDDAPVDLSYTVFVHLLAPDGTLLTQHDGLPQDGERPTTTWLPGEIIADPHNLQSATCDLQSATCNVQLGMYDLATMERLPAYDCAGQRLPDDAISLSLRESTGRTP